MGFLEDLTKNAALWSAVQASKGSDGKPDPYKAAGIAAGMGRFSASDVARLGAILGSEGAFDDDSETGFSGGSSHTDDYSWREECEEGLEYGIDAEDYETQEEYEEALQEAKYEWREECEEGLEYGIDAEDYETQEEYEEALQEAKYEKEKNLPTLQRKLVRRPQITEEMLKDKTIYHYVGVKFENTFYPYHYRTEDTTLKIGDKVLVPAGPQNQEVVAEVVSVEQHTRLSVPYPVEKVKSIIGKV